MAPPVDLLRVATYNVHACVGIDGRYDPDRVAAVVSELIVVVCGVVLAPSGIFNAKLRRTLFFAVLAGGAMALVAWLLRALNPFLAAPVALLAYGAALWATGEIDRSQFERIRNVVMRKLSRAR